MAKEIPFDFILEELFNLEIRIKAMFGAHAIYLDEKIVLILREKGDQDDGVWLATTKEHHPSLKKDFPNMRNIQIFGDKVTGWQNLAKDSEDFEQAVLRACAFVRKRDPRIGKVPKPRPIRKASPKKKSRQKK